MKNSLLFTVLVSAAFLVSCGSQQNFSSRKYTKGKFRVANQRFKSAQPEAHHDQQLVSHEVEQKNREQAESLIQMNLQEETKEATPETVFVDESHSTVPQAKDEVLVQSSSVTSTNAEKHQRKPRSEIAAFKEKKEKRNKKELNASQRQARSSLVWGITAVSLAAILLTLSILSMPAFPSPFLLMYFARSIRVAIIPAFIGAILGTFAKFGKEDLGKYEKHQKVGFWLSVSTILFWLLLV